MSLNKLARAASLCGKSREKPKSYRISSGKCQLTSKQNLLASDKALASTNCLPHVSSFLSHKHTIIPMLFKHFPKWNFKSRITEHVLKSKNVPQTVVVYCPTAFVKNANMPKATGNAPLPRKTAFPGNWA